MGRYQPINNNKNRYKSVTGQSTATAPKKTIEEIQATFQPGLYTPTPRNIQAPDPMQVQNFMKDRPQQELTQGKQTLGQKIYSKMPEFVQDAGTQIKEGLFGYEKERRAGSLPSSAPAQTRGYLPFLGRTEEEQSNLIEQRLLKKGIEPERARQIGTAKYVEDKQKGFMGSNRIGQDGQPILPDIDKLDLTPQEKRTLAYSDFMETAGKSLDSLSFIPIGSIKVAPTVATKIAKTKSAPVIKKLLMENIPGLTDEVAEAFSKVLIYADDVPSVQSGLNSLEYAIHGAKPGVSQITPAVQGTKTALSPLMTQAPQVSKQGMQPIFTGTKQVIEPSISKLSQLKQSPDFPRVDSELSTMIELSTPGNRVFTGYGADAAVQGVPSTFPEWIPEKLRSKDLMEKVYGHIENGTVPRSNATREMELYNTFVDHIESSIQPASQAQTAQLPSEMDSLQQIADQIPSSVLPSQPEPINPVSKIKDPQAEMLKMDAKPPSNVKIRSIKESDWDNLPLRDIDGIAGGKSLNMRDAAFSIDNLDVFEMAKRNDVGPVAKSFYNFKESEGSMFEWVDQTKKDLTKILNELNSEEKKRIATYRLGIDKTELAPELQKINKDLTKLTDEIRNFRNDWARSAGLQEMGYIDDYLTKKVETPLFTGREATKPSARYTLPRTDAEIQGVQEMNLEKILSSYISGIGKEVYLSGPLEQLKGVSGVLNSKGIVKGAKFIDDFVKETLNPDIASSFLEKGAQRLIGARSTSALLGNLAWSVTTQPLSLALTAGRNPQAKAIIKGFAGSFSKENKKWLKKLPTYREKVERPMSESGLGDLDSSKLTFSQKKAGFNRALGLFSDKVEDALSNISANVAREYGKSIGLSGDALDIYSDLMIGATQSEYTKTARPAALKSIWARVLAPFQTFAFEAYRFGKTLFGAPGGGIPIKQKSQRLKQASAYIATTLALDWMQSLLTGRRKTTPGSHIPIVGSVVDQSLSWGLSNVTGKDINFGSLGSYGRTPVSVYNDILGVQRAVDKFIKNGDKVPLRKELIKWGLGFNGIGGASTINRIFDNLDKEDKSSKGRYQSR